MTTPQEQPVQPRTAKALLEQRGTGLGLEICAALGLDPKIVTSINLTVQPGAHPIVIVTVVPRGPAGESLLPILKRYRLVERTDETPPSEPS